MKAGRVAGAVLLAMALAAPAGAQDEDDEAVRLTLPGSGRAVPLHVVEEDIFILADEDWCENLMALSGAEDAMGEVAPAEPLAVERCAAFMARLAANEVVLLPLSLARQLVALPDELLAPSAIPLPGSVAERVAVSGTGESTSQPFELAGGSYAVRVEVSPGCEFFAGFLTRATTGDTVADVDGAVGTLRGIEPGGYTWDVLAPGCDWEITLISQ